MKTANVATLCALMLSIPTLFLSGCATITNTAPEPTKSVIADHPSPTVLGETGDMGREYIDSIIFVGDSNTAHLVPFGVLPGGNETKQVWIPKGSTLTLDSQVTSKTVLFPQTGEYMTVAEAASRAKPQYLIISLGTNGVAALDERGFKHCYKKLIDAIKSASPDTRIIVQSIYPVTSWYDGFSNQTVITANEWLVSLAEECGIKYLDTASVLKDENGFLKEEYNSYHRDGYHINKEAAEKIIYYIRTHGYTE